MLWNALLKLRKFYYKNQMKQNIKSLFLSGLIVNYEYLDFWKNDEKSKLYEKLVSRVTEITNITASNDAVRKFITW